MEPDLTTVFRLTSLPQERCYSRRFASMFSRRRVTAATKITQVANIAIMIPPAKTVQTTVPIKFSR